MKMTDDVIRDLYPLYAEGEGTADTRALVEAWLVENPGLAAELRLATEFTLPARAEMRAPDMERTALHRTKRLLGRRTWSMALGFFLTGLPLSFSWDDQGIRLLFWPAHAEIMVASLAAGLAAWLVFVRTSRALRPSGF